MRVYLAGPMRGIPEFNFPEFNKWAMMLRSEGHEVFNPAERDTKAGLDTSGMAGDNTELDKVGFSLREALAADMEYIAKEAEAVAVMPGYKDSAGVAAEVALARAIGIPVARVHHFSADGDPVVRDQAAARKVDIRNEERTLGGRTYVATASDNMYTFNNFVRPGSQNTEEIMRQVSARLGFTPKGETVVSLPGGEVRTTSSTGGQKGVKSARFDLIPIRALTILAEHYGAGALKYDDHQWRKGYEWSKSYAAMQRHLTAFWNGEDLDPETGTPHLAAAAWHCFTLLTFMEEFPDFDDRFKRDAA